MNISLEKILARYQLEIGAATQRAVIAEIQVEQLTERLADAQQQLAIEPPADELPADELPDIPYGDA
jgi:uncharacterized coiled-coil protein SlyX